MFPNYPPEELYHQQHVTASPAWCVVLALVSFSRRSGAGASRELNLFKGFSWHPAQQLPLTSGRFYRKVGEKKKNTAIAHIPMAHIRGGACGKEPACQHRRRKTQVLSLRGEPGNPLQYSCLEITMEEEPGGLQFMGSQRVGHDWSVLACTHLPWPKFHN